MVRPFSFRSSLDALRREARPVAAPLVSAGRFDTAPLWLPP